MKTMWKLAVLLISAFLSSTSGDESNCGSLEERLLFTTDWSTEPVEYPWLGILFTRKGDLFENAHCNVVIVGDSHVVTPASCVRTFVNRPQWIAVRLGILNQTYPPDEDYICNPKGFCVPSPVQHLVSKIIVHPQADIDTGDNDLAILQLTKRIKTTPYIQSLCLQAISEPDSWVNRNFHCSGFDEENKAKDLAMTISRQFCTALIDSRNPPPKTHLCAYPVKRIPFYDGAVLMGLNIKEDIPRSFYLVGLLVKVVDTGRRSVLIFQDIKPLRRWITENINEN